MSFWKKLFGGESTPQKTPSKPHPQQPVTVQEPPPKPVEKDDSVGLLGHKIGRDGICLMCGCTESAIRNFNWKCRRPETPSPKAQPKIMDETAPRVAYAFLFPPSRGALDLHKTLWGYSPEYRESFDKKINSTRGLKKNTKIKIVDLTEHPDLLSGIINDSRIDRFYNGAHPAVVKAIHKYLCQRGESESLAQLDKRVKVIIVDGSGMSIYVVLPQPPTLSAVNEVRH